MHELRVHGLKNKLAIILGFCELLLNELAENSPHRSDVEQIHAAARSALAELPPLAGHDLSGGADPRAEAEHEHDG
jgi:hypothetical protein